MARKTSKRKAKAPRRKFQPQDLLFAGIGAVSLGKKQCLEAYSNVAELRDRSQEALLAAVGSINQQVQFLGQQAQARLAPVLARFGIARTVRAPVRRKARAGSRKAA